MWFDKCWIIANTMWDVMWLQVMEKHFQFSMLYWDILYISTFSN